MARQNQKSVIETFEKLKSGDYSRKGLDYEFVETDVRLKKIAEILNEAKDTTPPELEGKDEVSANILNAIAKYNEICREIQNFNPNESDPNQKVRGIEQNTRTLYEQIFLNNSNGQYSTFPALALQNQIDKFDTSDLKKTVGEINQLKIQAENLVSVIKDSSSSKFAHDYSKIFHNEATLHSRFQFFTSDKHTIRKKGLGYAEWYLLLGIILISLLFYLVFNNYFMPNSSELSETMKNVTSTGIESVTYTQLLIPYFIKKLIVLVILLFGIKFAFRQFSIHKHLHTLNKHRANTLDSFDFFYNSLKDGEAESKEQYLIEVAKSIFNTKETGFIKSDSKEPTSIIENLKLFKGQP